MTIDALLVPQEFPQEYVVLSQECIQGCEHFPMFGHHFLDSHQDDELSAIPENRPIPCLRIIDLAQVTPDVLQLFMVVCNGVVQKVRVLRAEFKVHEERLVVHGCRVS